MARLLHLSKASSARSIDRAGLRGSAIFAMPVVPDFAVTYQWVRELRRWHDERMIAVHFVIPNDEEVMVGRYNAAHQRLPVRDAIRRVLASPAGIEIVVLRPVPRREIAAIRDVTQLVGWTEVPEASRKFDCVCQMCIPPGARDLMRRVNAAYVRHVGVARKAKTAAEVLAALRQLDTVMERARGRISPQKLLPFAKSENPDVRRSVGWLLGYCRWADVGETLARLATDENGRVRESAVEAMERAGGQRRISM